MKKVLSVVLKIFILANVFGTVAFAGGQGFTIVRRLHFFKGETVKYIKDYRDKENLYPEFKFITSTIALKRNGELYYIMNERQAPPYGKAVLLAINVKDAHTAADLTGYPACYYVTNQNELNEIQRYYKEDQRKTVKVGENVKVHLGNRRYINNNNELIDDSKVLRQDVLTASPLYWLDNYEVDYGSESICSYFITTSNELWVQLPDEEYKKVDDNVKNCFGFLSRYYYITNDNKLFYKNELIDTDVSGINYEHIFLDDNDELSRYTIVYQKPNGEAYVHDNNGKVRATRFDNGAYIFNGYEKIGSCVTPDGKLYSTKGEFVDDVKKTDGFDDYSGCYINSNDELISYMAEDSTGIIFKTKALGGIKTWSNHLAVDLDNKLWTWSENMFPTLVRGNVLDIYENMLLDTNGTLWKYKSLNGAELGEQPEKMAENIETINWGNGTAVTKSGESIVYGNLMLLFQKSVNIMFSGNEIDLTLPVKMVDGRTMYPFRECLESMGAEVSWDGESQTAVGELDGNKVEFKIDSNEYKVNGKEMTMDVKTFIDEKLERTYIPLRYAAEGLGFHVDWQPGELEDTVEITK